MNSTGTPASRAASSSARVLSTTASRSAPSGDSGSVKPRHQVDDDHGGARAEARASPPNPPLTGARSPPRPPPPRPRARAPAPRRAPRAATSAAASPAAAPAARSRPRSRRASSSSDGPEVERLRVAALGALPRPLGLGGRRVDAPSAEHDAVRRQRLLARDEPERHVARDRLDRPVEPVLPAAAARRAVDQHVAGLHLDLVALGRQHLLGAVGAPQQLGRALARLAAEHAPRPRQPAVVVDRDVARLEVDVALLDPVAAAVQARRRRSR